MPHKSQTHSQTAVPQWVADTAEVGDAAQVAHATIFDDATTGLLCEYRLWLPRLCDRVNVVWHTSRL